MLKVMVSALRHCEERSDEAIHLPLGYGLLRHFVPRNDGKVWLLPLKLGFLLLLLTTVMGCSSHLSRSQCLGVDWIKLGYADGSVGNKMSDMQQLRYDCAKYKIAVNYRLYQLGWKYGVRTYCDLQKAQSKNAYQEDVVC